MGLEGFIEPLCCAVEKHQRGVYPTPMDAIILDVGISQFKKLTMDEASPHLDKFLQALLLREIWAERKIEDVDVHSYMNSLLWRYLPMNDDLRENRFFYLETNDE